MTECMSGSIPPKNVIRSYSEHCFSLEISHRLGSCKPVVPLKGKIIIQGTHWPQPAIVPSLVRVEGVRENLTPPSCKRWHVVVYKRNDGPRCLGVIRQQILN